LGCAQTYWGRLDVVCRVFYAKLKKLLSEVLDEGILRRVLSLIYTIEFQKRGLPHFHMLIIVDRNYKPETPELVDRLVLCRTAWSYCRVCSFSKAIILWCINPVKIIRMQFANWTENALKNYRSHSHRRHRLEKYSSSHTSKCRSRKNTWMQIQWSWAKVAFVLGLTLWIHRKSNRDQRSAGSHCS